MYKDIKREVMPFYLENGESNEQCRYQRPGGRADEHLYYLEEL